MITKKYVLMEVSNESQVAFCQKFEALYHITREEEIKEVWKKNKIPVMLEKDTANVSEDVQIVEIPSELFNVEYTESFIKSFINYCHINGFECGEYISGKTYNTADERCFLCELANYKGMINNTLAAYNEHVEDDVDCIIYESPHFFIVPELGSLKPGYLMIVPKGHYLSIAQIPPVLINEYTQVCKDAEYILEGTYRQPVTFFEHGSGPSGITSHKKSIVHAHTHVIAGFKLDEIYKKMVQLTPIDDISVAKKNHYFSYQEGTDGDLMICMNPDIYVQRQFPRQILAEELGLAPEQYNWKKYKFAENSTATLYRIYIYLTANNLPKRIYDRTKGFVDGYERREGFQKA